MREFRIWDFGFGIDWNEDFLFLILSIADLGIRILDLLIGFNRF